MLANYLDFLVIRTNASIDDMLARALSNTMSVINAMSDNEHPTQATGDLVTIKEALGGSVLKWCAS